MEKNISLKGYIDEQGKFERLPGKKQKRKLDAMLLVLSKKFKLGKIYSETQVNEILNQQHSFNDPATLRRLLFGTNILNRTNDGKEYWLTQSKSV